MGKERAHAWQLLSAEEKESIRLNGKKQLKVQQKEICQKLSCPSCPNALFTSIAMYRRHLESKKHLRRTKRHLIANTWSCKLCNIVLPNESEWNKHASGRKHHLKMKKYGKEHYPMTEPYLESDIQRLKQSEFKEEVEEDGDDLYPALIG
ncbi:hypothetical protein SAMD00019534_016560 [Acytostelium subglobosum LB1]|uniref:hypothetical protein n=1 Tax=Acytostelium subglobosum LB1 TaxID=1410327 RepID=UPI000644DCEC|nr:hypothetical protein SAMD00019534_016560 [Acytostelium subglobosum LB1]GAM18481.1 hypothetical protein SAMD00019534_016560 [Acytostelium subglobosum LB1]|eukprot:XP_012757701.1 hypothetical protein SAMD00019534_016560 [Acytostelium subglobosum LB1]